MFAIPDSESLQLEGIQIRELDFAVAVFLYLSLQASACLCVLAQLARLYNSQTESAELLTLANSQKD